MRFVENKDKEKFSMRFISERIRKTYEEIGRYVYSNTLNIDNYKL